MLLSQKLNKLREDTNQETAFSDEMVVGFTECMKQAEAFEKAFQSIIEEKDKALNTQDLFAVLQEIEKARNLLPVTA